MKLSTSGDPAWAGTFSNIASLFDPKVEAEGATLRAKQAALAAEARYNTAKAAGVEDQNTALGIAVLEAAGYSPQEIAAIRAARPNSVQDIAHGQNTFRGRIALEKGDVGTALPLLGQANAYDDYVKGDSQKRMLTAPDGTFNYPLAAAIAGGAHELGGNVVTLGSDGKPILGPVTAEGQAKVSLLGTQAANDTSRTTSQNNLDKVRGETIAKTGDAMVDLRQKQGEAVTTKAENDTRKTDAVVTATEANTANKTRETDARINRINANINNDALRAAAAAANGSDPVKKAQAEGQLRTTIEGFYGKEFSENLGKPGVWEQLDPAQKRSLTERALEYVKRNDDLGTAMRKSEADHGLTGKTIKGQKSKFWGISSTPDGKITLEGFTPPSALAAVTAAGAAPSFPAPAAGTLPAASPANSAGKTYPAISAGAIQMLRKDPSLASKFDQTYGPGAAQKVLGQ